MSHGRKNWKAIDLVSPKSKAISTWSPGCFSQGSQAQIKVRDHQGPCPLLDLVNKYEGKAKHDIIVKT